MALQKERRTEHIVYRVEGDGVCPEDGGKTRKRVANRE